MSKTIAKNASPLKVRSLTGARVRLRSSAILWGSVVALSSLIACGNASPPPCVPASNTEASTPAAAATEATPSRVPAAPTLSLWQEGATKKSIVDFVTSVTSPESPSFVPEEERIAVFDNDGTLWSEQPFYVQLAFAIDQVKVLAPKHPEWKSKQPFKAVLDGDLMALMGVGTKGLLELIMATHAGMTAEEFDQIASEWLKTAKHPQYHKLYTELTYAPMVELLAYLRAHGFKTFIVSGGGVAFMRPFTEAAYGIPRDQVIGSRIESTFEVGLDGPVIRRKPDVGFVDDGAGKPVGIYESVGRRPIFAAGNSDGDLQMIQWTLASEGPHFGLLVHHTDAERESAYDRKSSIGKLDKALDAATAEGAAATGWTVVDMKTDWKKIFAFEGVVASESPVPATATPSPTPSTL